MTIYADTGFLVALYVEEPFSRAASRMVQSRPVVLVNALHLNEFTNAISLRCFRREFTQLEADLVRQHWNRHRSEGVYREIEWMRETWDRAEELSTRHSAAIGTRTLDVLHVAAALLVRPDAFVSFDRRQRALARAEGMQVKPDIKWRGTPPL